MRSLLLLLIGAGLAAGAVWWAWRSAPLTSHATDATALMTAAVAPDVRELAQEESTVVYVSPPEVASALRVGSQLKASKVRASGSGCTGDKARVATAPCAAGAHVQVAIQSIPFWNLALVRVTTGNSSQEKMLLRLGGEWVIVGTRGYVF